MRRCCQPIIPILEFELGDDILIAPKSDISIPITPETDIDELKDKVICEYKRIITALERGKEEDLEFLLEEISAINLDYELGKNREFIIEYYLNN